MKRSFTLAFCDDLGSSCFSAAWAQPPSTRINFTFGEASQSVFQGSAFGVAFAPAYSGSVDLLQWGFPGVRQIGPINAMVALPGDPSATFNQEFVLDRPATFQVEGGDIYNYIFHQKVNVESHNEVGVGQVSYIAQGLERSSFDLGDSGVLDLSPWMFTNQVPRNQVDTTPLGDFALNRPNAIPEPGALGLLALGLLTTAGHRFRTRRCPA